MQPSFFLGLDNSHSRWTRYAIILLVTGIYLIISIVFRHFLGNEISAIALFPVVIASWNLGLKAGLIWSLVLVSFDVLALQFYSHLTIEQILSHGVVADLFALLGASVIIGWARKTIDQERAELVEKKKAEVIYRESEQRYRLLFENMTEGVAFDKLVYNSQGSVVDWAILDANQAYERILGFPKSDVIENHASKIYKQHPEGIKEFLSDFEYATKTGNPITREAHTVKSNRDISLTIIPITDTQIATIFSDITDQKRALEAEREQRKLAEALRDIAAVLNSSLHLEKVLDRIFTHIGKITSFDSANLMLIDHDVVRIVRHLGYAERGLEENVQNLARPVNDLYFLEWMIKNKKALVIPDTEKDPLWALHPEMAWIRSYVGIPIIRREKIIGFLNFDSMTTNFFTKDGIERLQPFADQAALAIENARTYEETRKNARQLAIVNKAALMLNQPLHLNAVLQVTVDSFADALNIDQVGLALFEDDQQHLILRADHPAPGNSSLVGSEIPLPDNQSMEFILGQKIPLLVNQAQQNTQLEVVRPFMLQQGIQSILIVPLLVRGEVIGTIGCDLVEPGRQFTPEEIELAETLSNLAAVRIEQARLFGEESKRAAELAMLHATSLDITMPHDLPTLLHTIVERAAWLLDAPSGTLYICDPEKEELECKVAYKTGYDREGNKQKYGEGAAGIVAVTGKPLIIPNYREWDQRPTHFISLDKSFALLNIPVAWQNNVVGVIQLLREEGQKTFTSKDLDLLSMFSNQVAISLENSRLLQEIQHIAIHDALTGLYNRRGLIEIGEREIERARRFDRPFCVLLLDVDHFKEINDYHGHLAGDHLLAYLAKKFRQNIRNIDVIGRLGGDEFLILLIENDFLGALQVADRLRASIETSTFEIGASSGRVTLSIGVAELNPEMKELSDLINVADKALYQAKKAGRNQVR